MFFQHKNHKENKVFKLFSKKNKTNKVEENLTITDNNNETNLPSLNCQVEQTDADDNQVKSLSTKVKNKKQEDKSETNFDAIKEYSLLTGKKYKTLKNK